MDTPRGYLLRGLFLALNVRLVLVVVEVGRAHRHLAVVGEGAALDLGLGEAEVHQPAGLFPLAVDRDRPAALAFHGYVHQATFSLYFEIQSAATSKSKEGAARSMVTLSGSIGLRWTLALRSVSR